MKRKIYFIYFLSLICTSVVAMAQTTISGRVLDQKDKPIKGASVYLNNTLDGGTTDSAGFFSFITTETGNQSLVASDATHTTMGMPLVITGANITGLLLKMRQAVLDQVVITAGSFASGDRAVTVMSPLDIVTTAGSNGDVVKAMQMMPGTQQTPNDNGLVIRGGDPYEAAVIIDGITAQSAFSAGPPGMATRSRFNAFQYQGVQFSSGGYSARFGQALSGVLELNTNDLADKSNVNLGVNMAGLYASGTHKRKNSSLDVGANYLNLGPAYALATQNFKFSKVPQGGGGYARYAWKPNKDAIFKATLTGTYSTNGVDMPNPAFGTTDTSSFMTRLPDTINYLTRDNYFFGTATYKQTFKSKYMLYAAASGSFNRTNNKFGGYPILQDEYRYQARVEGKKYINSRLTALVGSDVQHYGITKTMGKDYMHDSFRRNQSFEENITSAYAEMEWTPKYWLAIKPGVRYEYSALLETSQLAPRLSAAIKTGVNSQVSLAGGIFYQNANNNYYLLGLRPEMSHSVHYIANWQISKKDRTFRIEGYHKDYQNLVRELINPDSFVANRYRQVNPNIPVNNKGYGYANGLELFWRDKKTIKNGDYWISYSYIDTRRIYENFPVEGTPTFIAKHNLNIVGKYFVDKLHTNFSATYSFADGYPYFNPEKGAITSSNFLKDKTPSFNNVAVTVAYLHSFGKWFTVFYAQVDNVFNFQNVSGYRYIPQSGGYSRNAIVPAMYRTVFVGVNMSLSQFSKDEL